MVPRRFTSLLVVLVLVSLSCNFVQSLDPPEKNQNMPGGALLNEALFLPASGESPFIELKSSGRRVSLNGLYLVNERGDTYSLPDGVNTLSPDQFLLIIFDGANTVEDETIHASQIGFLNPESGFIELYASDSTLLDRVAWGSEQPDSVRLSRGGKISELMAGTTIGRYPASTGIDPAEWVTFSPAQATPGARNPNPGVEVLLPLNGAVFASSSITLSWYPVAGATQYRVQVAADEAFTNPLIDETVDTPQFQATSLAPGVYYWHVQAIAADGSTAGFSSANLLTVENASAIKLPAPNLANPLAVPWIPQHKDTAMLLLESKNETGVHAWDVDHKVLDPGDLADNMNCSLASTAMVNQFYGGKLSQDRIGFQVFKNTQPGPEKDLNDGRGLNDNQITQAITFALGAAPTYHAAPKTADVLWTDITNEINARRPVIASNPFHVFVIVGYSEAGGKKLVTINDPWIGTYKVDIASPQTSQLGQPWDTYWLMPAAPSPASDEPEISMDSDGDGIVDFDEANRFGTSSNDGDFDKDDLKDKDDIRGSIFDPHFGYAITGDLLGRDYDGDGISMEKDEDSDDGGCFDGLEDYNLDGKYKEPEIWNFDEKDDACFWGTEEAVMEVTTVYEDGSSIHQYQRHFAKFSLRAVEGGKLEGVAQVSYTHTGEQIELDSTCGGTYTLVGGETQLWQVDLKGDFQRLPDGSTLVSAEATPDHGPPYTLQWIGGPCASYGEPWSDEGWPFTGLGGTLKDGVYDVFTDLSSSDYEEFWQRIHMEQGQGQ